MDHDIDFRDVMSELLKKRRKLAAVRLQFWPSAPQEIVKFLRDKLVVRRTALYPNFAAGPRAFVPPGQPRFGRQQPRFFLSASPPDSGPRGL